MTAEAPKLHRRSIRLPGYDYAQPGAYFVTIVAAGRANLFGRIDNGEVQLDECGRISQQQWNCLPSRFPDLELGVFIIMPNHLHGILVLHDRRGTAGNLADRDDTSYRRAPTEEFRKPVPGSIPTIVRSFKSAAAYRIHAQGLMIGKAIWQRNYYERIIRDDNDWARIHRYIESNPALWAQDEENPSNYA